MNFFRSFVNTIPSIGSVLAVIYLVTDILVVGYTSVVALIILIAISKCFLIFFLYKFGWKFLIEAEIHVGQIMVLLFYLFLMALMVVTGF